MGHCFPFVRIFCIALIILRLAEIYYLTFNLIIYQLISYVFLRSEIFFLPLKWEGLRAFRLLFLFPGKLRHVEGSNVPIIINNYLESQ